MTAADIIELALDRNLPIKITVHGLSVGDLDEIKYKVPWHAEDYWQVLAGYGRHTVVLNLNHVPHHDLDGREVKVALFSNDLVEVA